MEYKSYEPFASKLNDCWSLAQVDYDNEYGYQDMIPATVNMFFNDPELFNEHWVDWVCEISHDKKQMDEILSQSKKIAFDLYRAPTPFHRVQTAHSVGDTVHLAHFGMAIFHPIHEMATCLVKRHIEEWWEMVLSYRRITERE